MITIHTKKETAAQKTLSRPASQAVATALLATGIFFSSGSPALAQQRVIVEKATGNVVDVGEPSLQYDQRYYDHMDVAINPIPRGQDVRKYMRDAAGAIVLRPKDERVAAFADDRRDDLITRINGLALPPDVKSLLIDIVKGLRP
jgi:hypothetical protein